MTEFEKKVRLMSVRDTILAMVQGLRNPVTNIDMSSYGYVVKYSKKCFGCAATNTICQIGGFTKDDLIKTTKTNFDNGLSVKKVSRMKLTGSKKKKSKKFINAFEIAIDYLRQGNLEMANDTFRSIKLNLIINPKGLFLPSLTNRYTESQLVVFEQLANSQL